MKIAIKRLLLAHCTVFLFVGSMYGQTVEPPMGITYKDFLGDNYFFPAPALASNTSRDIFPVSPQASSLGIFGQIPVGNFTGAAQIGIPLYEIQYKELSVPILINYHSSGNKPDAFPGPLGLGWSLLAGGAISRQINGETDMGTHTSSDHELSKLTSDPRLSSTWPNMSEAFQNLQGTSIAFDNTIDIDPDEYSFNINGHTGKFYLNHRDTFQIQSAQGGSFLIVKHPRTNHVVTFPILEDHFPPYLTEIPPFSTPPNCDDIHIPVNSKACFTPNCHKQWDEYEKKYDERMRVINRIVEFYGVNPYLPEFAYTNQVRIPGIIGGFTMIDSNGIKYIFGATDGSNKSDKSIEFSRPGFYKDNYSISIDADGDTYLNGYVQPMSWMLTAIESPAGYKIEFKYEQECYIEKSRFTDLALFKHPSNTDLKRSTNAMTEDGERASFINGCYLKEIVFPTGKVSFSASVARYQETYIAPTSYNAPNKFIKFCSYPDIRFANTERILSSHYLSDVYNFDPVLDKYLPHQFDTITVFDDSNNVIRKIDFTYGNSMRERLKLTSLDIKAANNTIQNYKFEYNSTLLPEYLSGKTDHYGFYNGTMLFPNSNNITQTLIENQNYIKERKTPTGQNAQAEMLMKIIYPTKGYTTFEYESHNYSKSCQTWPFDVINNSNGNQITGGVRIKSIKNYNSNNSLLTEKKYYYTTNYLNGGASSSGVLAYIPKYSEVYENKQIWYSNDQKNASTLAKFYRFSTTSLYNQTAARGNHITYSEVTVEESGNGFIVYKYKNHDNGYGDKQPLYYSSNTLKDAATKINEEFWKADEGISMELERGQILSEEIYDKDKNRKSKILYSYNDATTRFNQNVRYVKLNSNSIRFTGYRSQRMTAGVHYTYFPYLKEKKEIIYFGSDSIMQKENFTYDERYRLIKSKKRIDSQNQNYMTEIFYTIDQDSSTQIVKKMLEKNMLAYPFRETMKFPDNQTEKIIFKYKNDWSSLQIPMLHKKSTQRNSNSEYLETEVLRYDSYGNPSAVFEHSVGNTCILWSYKGQYPIARIENATYDQVVAQIQGGQAAIDAIAASNIPSAADQSKINDLRTKLPKAQITTYTYKPLIGIESMTAPRNITTYYGYDAFGRLKETYYYEKGVKKVIENYDYHYKL